MNNEIKEILDKAKEISKYGVDGKQHTRFFNQFEAKSLLDYITNLQQENEYSNYCNEKLREKISNLEYKITELEEINKQHQELNGTLRNENERLKEKLNVDLKWALRCDDLFKERNNYKSIIDKAIEYINKNKHLSMFADCREPEEDWNYDLECSANDLLNILQDKEEV